MASEQRETLPERIERIGRAWSGWSRAERRVMGAIVQEVISHCADGTGNKFIREWCNRHLVGVVPGFVVR